MHEDLTCMAETLLVYSERIQREASRQMSSGNRTASYSLKHVADSCFSGAGDLLRVVEDAKSGRRT